MLEEFTSKLEAENFEKASKIIEKSIFSKGGQERVEMATDFLMREYNKKRFNSERALEVYTIAIERCLLDDLGGDKGNQAVKVFRKIGATRRGAEYLVDQFKKMTNATDQRPPRKGLWAKIIGR